MQGWREEVYEELKGFTAPRLVSVAEVTALVLEKRRSVSRTSARNFVEAAEMAGALVPVRKGLWLNALAFPAPTYAEAIPRVRAEAVVSLQTVLGDAGILNNYTSNVYSVLPADRVPGAGSPFAGSVKGKEASFFFHTIRRDVLEAGPRLDRLSQLVNYPRATAEAALLHWMYLAHVRRSEVTEPDTQCDISLLDRDRLSRLCSSVDAIPGLEMDMGGRIENWLDRCMKREDDDDNHVGWGPGA